uniref:C2H2-type domain-containing protein n=1 Tax=Anopheles minimus TaxID=112268 RepID=A0A182WFR6_9DIPT
MSGHDLALDDEAPVDDSTQLYSHCYLCHSPVVQDEFCQLFTDSEFSSPAKILGNVLDMAIMPDLCHSLIICNYCNTLCTEYQSLVERMETIHNQITTAYNQTVMKLAGLTEKDIKDGLVTVEYDDNLETELQTFNKELMSMEEVFGVNELNPDIIEEDASAEHLPDTAADMQQLGPDEVVEHRVQFLNVDKHATVLLPTDSDAIVEKSICPEELPVEETLQRFIIGSDETIVEVDAEDGTSIYCVYGESIETFSEPEEQLETELNSVTTDSISEGNGVAVDSTYQGSANGAPAIEESVSATSLLLKDVDDTGARSPVPSEGDNFHPYIKIENFYCCTLCPSEDTTVSTSDLKLMTEHLQEAHNQQLHTCALCSAILFRRSDYIDHLVQHTRQARGHLTCDQCDAKFVKQHTLEQHRKTHQSDKAKAWNCELCDKKYTSKAFFEVHMNKHAGLRPYKCTKCTKDFSSKYALALHLKTHYDRPRTFVCSECGSAFYSRHNLVQHERTHRAEREFECDHCGKKFFTQHNLNVHKVIHSSNKAFACRQCGKKFARKAEVRDHERTHTGEKPFPRISANDLLEFETESFVVDGQAEGEPNQDVEDSEEEEQSQIAFICDGEYEDGEREME